MRRLCLLLVARLNAMALDLNTTKLPNRVLLKVAPAIQPTRPVLPA